ncbi:response regulator [Halovenus marina]|uniref:response regulator n=1 Tax=Halovenus marina TaxID=3396621 RepID=UPI003F56230D
MADNPSRVLIVDDEEDVVEIYGLALDDEYEVWKAYSGEQALEQIDETVDVVLLDRRMPGLSGHEVLEAIRARGLDVRVAMVTAVDPGFDITEMNFDAYLTKPVDDEAIRDVVGELVTLSSYDDRTKELFAVAQKKAALEAEKTDRELIKSDEYETLQERSAELDGHTTEQLAEMDDELFEKMLSGLSDEDATPE